MSALANYCFHLCCSVWFFLAADFPAVGADQQPPRSYSQELENAAVLFADSQYEAAGRRFAELSKVPTNSAFVRGLAGIGVAETALARKETGTALQAWEHLVKDASLPVWQRELAQRRIAETERLAKGLPERDPVAYRTRLPALPDAAAVFHVAPHGNDSADGAAHRPFATLARAREAIRDLKKSQGGTLPGGGVKVLIHNGIISSKETFKLNAEDSGSAGSPVVYQAETNGGTVVEGGRALQGWKAVTDSAVQARFRAEIRNRVLQVDLKANGVLDWGDATDLKRRPELFVNGVPQILARWPNEGFVETGEILGTNTFKVWNSIPGCKDGKFRFVEDQARSWVDEPDVRLYGYWFWDWYEEYQKVASIDADQRTFTLAKPFSAYGYRKGQRYFAVNVLRELDQSGEWYLDRRSGMLYWLPPENTQVSKAHIVLSIQTEPFIILENVEHVVLMGLTIQESRGDGIRVKGGSDCLLAGLTLRRLGGDAIVVDGGHRHTIFGCAMHVLGHGGMRVNGGDRQSLTPGQHVVENCTVSDISRIKRTYAPAVHLDGCGNRVAHNLFERIPSSAMRIEGNDHLIELNCIRQVVQESDDQGGIDMFGNPLYRGVVIRWNRWSDIVGGTECGAAGIRLDDMISGIVLQGNLFERCGAVQFGGVQIHGGKENVVDNNVFIDCHAGISFSRWDEPRWLQSIEPFLKQAGQEPYAARYPDLALLKSEPNVNYASRNLLFGCRNVFLRDGSTQRSVLMMVRREHAPAELATTGQLKTSELRRALFEPIPVAEMGLYPHPWRAGELKSK